MRESPSLWAYPTVLTLHTVGLGIVVGASAVIDLRLLGYARRIRVVDLAPLFALMAWAFVLNAVTGILLFIADATTKSTQPVFYIKLALIFIALWCTFCARGASCWQPDYSCRDVVPSTGRAAGGRRRCCCGPAPSPPDA